VNTPGNPFQEYAWFSVQVDQYYAATKIFARHYAALKAAYTHLPLGDTWPKDFTCLSEAATNFFVTAASALNCMGTTRIFEDAPFSQLASLPSDLINFGFYTCYCFQWTLFENFIKRSLFDLVDDGILPASVGTELRKREFRTAAFLQFVDSGQVFGHSPFSTVLPIAGWTPKFENCDFSDLNAIREQRNKFIHAVENTSILPNTEMEKECLYDRSMWILRQFAGNVFQDAQRLRALSNPNAQDAEPGAAAEGRSM
jgi:hypothetical protein